MIKIYQDAKEKIERHLKELEMERHLNSTETAYKVLKVEEKLVEFEIHDSLKLLIDDQYEYLTGDKRHSIIFINNEDDEKKWKIVVESGGVESYFFSYVLEVIVGVLSKQKRDRINSDKAAIKSTLDATLQKLNADNKYPNRVWYKKGIYYMLARGNGAKIMFQNQCPQMLQKEIETKLADLIGVIMKK